MNLEMGDLQPLRSHGDFAIDLNASGVALSSIELVHVNSAYVRGPAGISWPDFFARADVTDDRPLLREQAFGESLDPDKLERLGRYEVHLDRKLERMLAMLIRLKDLRQGTSGS
jgi:hypothetical protein